MPSESAAYTPPVGIKSLEHKLMHNGERGADYFEPEWAEVRVIMREHEQMRRALELIASGEYADAAENVAGDVLSRV